MAEDGQIRHYPSRVPRNVEPGPWKNEIIDTTAGADYLTDTEKQVIVELNMVRTDPAEYARRILMPLRFYYHGSLLEYPRETPILTKEGILALEESISVLLVTKPLPPLFPKEGLTLSARDLVKDQGQTGGTGHIGSDNSTPDKRISRYRRWSISAGENIDYGNAEARRIVTSLLIDDGETSRMHRKVIFNSGFKFVGVSIGPHKVYGHMCVIDLAGGYR